MKQLLLNLAYVVLGVYCSGQHCTGNSYSVGQWVKISKLLKDFVCCAFRNDDFLKIPACGSARLNISTNFMQGSNDVHVQMGGNGCACDKADPLAISNREKFAWKPFDCNLAVWNGSSFCAALDNRVILGFGDSTMHQSMSTLIALVNAAASGCSHHLISGGGIVAGKNESNLMHFEPLVDQFKPDILILTAGAHYHSLEEMHSVWHRELIPQLRRVMRRYPAMKLVWKTQNPGHVSCSNFTQPFIPCSVDDATASSEDNIAGNTTTEGKTGAAACIADKHQVSNMFAADDRYEWRFHSKFDEINRQYATFFNMSIIDMTPLYYRPDAHPGSGTKIWDCLHYCQPGPVNFFAEILHHLLVTKQL